MGFHGIFVGFNGVQLDVGFDYHGILWNMFGYHHFPT